MDSGSGTKYVAILYTIYVYNICAILYTIVYTLYMHNIVYNYVLNICAQYMSTIYVHNRYVQ